MEARSCQDGSVIKKSVRCSDCGKKQYDFRISYLMNDGTRGLFPMRPEDNLFNFGIGYDIKKPVCHMCWSLPDIIKAQKLRRKHGK